MTSTSTEVNNKQQSNHSMLGKRKKVREKRSNYLHKWIERSMQHTLDAIPDTDVYESFNNSLNGNYWNAQQSFYGQRLFNAASDPSVFRYSTPFGFPHEPMSLPVYPSPVYPPMFPNNLPPVPPHAPKYAMTPQKKKLARRSKKNVSRKNTCIGIEKEFSALQNGPAKVDPSSGKLEMTNNDFASLPPAFNRVVDSFENTSQENDNTGNQRRFSDPGISQNQSLEQSLEESQEETDSNSSVRGGSQVDNRLIMCLVDQINSLKETNRKLYKELHETRAELDGLKHQTSIWRNDSTCNLRQSPQPSGMGSQSAGLANSSTMYTPGMLTDLVREIRDAAKIREEALYAKVRTLLEERNSNNKNHVNGPPEWRQYDHHQKNQVHVNGLDKTSRNNDRLSKLEDEFHNLRLHHSREEASHYPGPPASLPEHERQRLRAELSEERAARAAADAHAHRLELLVTQLRSKRGSANQTPSHNGSISSPPDALHMVLGPVTDL